MATVKSGINKVGNSYYQSITQDDADGNVGTTFYRVNPDGSSGVPIYDVDKPAGSSSPIKSFDPNATAEEQRLLSDPNSQLSQVRSQQVISSNLYANPSPIQNSTLAQAGGGSGNAATNTGIGGGDPQTATSSIAPQPQQQAQPQNSTLIYPIEMRSTQQDRIKFTAVTYTPSGNLATGQITSPNRTSTTGKTQVGPTVFLPIQASISDANSVDWQGANLNAIERELSNLSLAAMKTQTTKDLTGLFATKGEEAIQNITKYGDLVRVALAGEAVGIQNLVGRFGSVLNPNLELLFTGPQLRPFEFSFKLSAREQDEANNIRQIINFFKKNMSVKKSTDGIFLRSPNTFFIEYMYKGQPGHKGINKIKECALMNCSVDYTPLGTYMTYEDGTMVSYTLSLQFQELVPIYEEDYTDFNQIEY
jgi:hypothetical protein